MCAFIGCSYRTALNKTLFRAVPDEYSGIQDAACYVFLPICRSMFTGVFGRAANVLSAICHRAFL